jgi:hypothetical protein
VNLVVTPLGVVRALKHFVPVRDTAAVRVKRHLRIHIIQSAEVGNVGTEKFYSRVITFIPFADIVQLGENVKRVRPLDRAGKVVHHCPGRKLERTGGTVISLFIV